jgi:phosphoribosylglycinamide formyltransferase 1
MVKLTGNKINAAVFISGNGTNLNSIIKKSKKKNFPIKVCLVISNNKNAPGLLYAKKNNIAFKTVSSLNMNKFEKYSLKYLQDNKIKIICLAGFMKILSKKFINAFKFKIINIHPSLLPKYKGTNTHSKVIKNKDKFTGSTVHYVTEKLDSGKIIMQKKIKINKNDTAQKLKKKILIVEHSLYPKAIIKVLKSNL